jgi:hypothetical protein
MSFKFNRTKTGDLVAAQWKYTIHKSSLISVSRKFETCIEMETKKVDNARHYEWLYNMAYSLIHCWKLLPTATYLLDVYFHLWQHNGHRQLTG